MGTEKKSDYMEIFGKQQIKEPRSLAHLTAYVYLKLFRLPNVG